MPDDALRQSLHQATLEYLEQARCLLPGQAHRLSAVHIRCDLRGRTAGQMRGYGDGRLEIRYNLEIAALQPQAFLAETVPHEVAHLVVWLTHGRSAKPHGPEWRAVMQHLGIMEPRRCHDFQNSGAAIRRQRRWPYRCACSEYPLSTTRHRRVLHGKQEYLCAKCGQTLQPVDLEDPARDANQTL